MGSYVTLSIAGHEVLSTKNSIDSASMTLFVEDDKVARVNGQSVPVVQFLTESLKEGDEAFLGYETVVHIARDRLEVMGYTMPRVRTIFEEGIAAWRREHEDVDWESQGLALERELISHLCFEEWLEALDVVLRAKVTGDGGYSRWLECHRLAPLLLGEFVLADDWHYGFPDDDCRPVIRAALHLFADEDLVVQDLTDAFHAGWSTLNEPLAQEARENLSFEYPRAQKIVVLTEGSSDAWILAGALRVLYPHLVEYYSFQDFEVARPQGGAGSLVQTIRAFVAAGIANRVVAVFDNDTAAEEALTVLQKGKLPPNLRIVQHPPLELARSYPTLGPTGLQIMDVNGLAGGIEMYFGEDILRTGAGDLLPVQWRGFSEKLQKYQGEIVRKDEVQRKFREKLTRAPQAGAALQMPEWQPMQLVLRAIFTAFG